MSHAFPGPGLAPSARPGRAGESCAAFPVADLIGQSLQANPSPGPATAVAAPPARQRAAFIPGPPTIYDAVDGVQAVVDRLLPRTRPRRVLEAGCGSCGHVEIRPDDHLVGIDISERQLARNTTLHEKICGDLQTHALAPASFDLVVCWYVLEHLPRPQLALDRMVRSLRPGGLLVLAQPSPLSPKGLITKFTPHWFHVGVYRYVFGRRQAGRDDNPPFPTFLSWAIRPAALRNYGRAHDLTVVYDLRFEDYTQRRLRTERPIYRAAYVGLDRVLRALSGGRYDAYHSDYVLVLRKPGADLGQDAVVLNPAQHVP